MNRQKKLSRLQCIIWTIIFIIMLVGGLTVCSRITADKQSKHEKGSFKDNLDYEVVFMGTSHVYHALLPMEIWNEYGIASYNWGYSNSTVAQNYYILKEIAKYKKPKVLVLDLNGLVEYEDEGNGKYKGDALMQSRVLWDSFPLSLNKIIAVNDLFDDYENRADFLWNFIIYHNRWTDLDLREELKSNMSDEKGAHFLEEQAPSGFDYIGENAKLEDIKSYTCYAYLEKIIDFCQNQDINLLCVYVPHPMDEQSQRSANTIGDILRDEYDCTYLNLVDSGILAFNTDIYVDGGHVNYSGACKTSSFLGSYLKDNYELTDYSQDTKWNKDYQKYLNYRISVMQQCNTLHDYFMLLKNPGVDATITIYDENIWYSEVLASELYFGNLSAESEESPDGYAAHIVIKYPDGSIADDAYFEECDGEYCRVRTK